MYSRNWCVTCLSVLPHKCQRGSSQTGKAARGKVLVFLGPHNSNDHFRLQVSVTCDFTDWSLWRREAASTWGSPWESWTLHLPDTAIRHTPSAKRLLAGYWAPVETECLTHGGLMSLPSDIPTLGWANSYSMTNNVKSQLKMHIWDYNWRCLGPRSFATVSKTVVASPLEEMYPYSTTRRKGTGSTEPTSSKSSTLTELIHPSIINTQVPITIKSWILATASSLAYLYFYFTFDLFSKRCQNNPLKRHTWLFHSLPIILLMYSITTWVINGNHTPMIKNNDKKI